MTRHLVYLDEYAKENSVMCENHDNRYAFATIYDTNWDERDYCHGCFEEWSRAVLERRNQVEDCAFDTESLEKGTTLKAKESIGLMTSSDRYLPLVIKDDLCVFLGVFQECEENKIRVSTQTGVCKGNMFSVPLNMFGTYFFEYRTK